MSAVAVIRKFFDSPPVSFAELKAISPEDRRELADMVAVEMGLRRRDGDGKYV